MKAVQGLTITETPIKIKFIGSEIRFEIGKIFLAFESQNVPIKVFSDIKEALDEAYKLGYSDCSMKLLNKEKEVDLDHTLKVLETYQGLATKIVGILNGSINEEVNDYYMKLVDVTDESNEILIKRVNEPKESQP